MVAFVRHSRFRIGRPICVSLVNVSWYFEGICKCKIKVLCLLRKQNVSLIFLVIRHVYFSLTIVLNVLLTKQDI